MNNRDNTSDSGSGRILRLKQGYNPNSSSIGSIVFAVPALILALPAVFGAATAVILAALPEREKDSGTKEEQ